MAAITGKAQCILCGKERSAVRCEGCLQFYCYHHLADHRQDLNKQLDEIEVDRDQFRDTLTQQTNNLEKHASIQQIDQWKEDSIKKIEQTAEECKQLFLQYITELITEIEVNLNKLTEELRHIRQEDDFNEIDLKQFNDRLKQLTKELDQPPTISIQQDSASPVNKISVVIGSSKQGKEMQKSQQQHANDELLLNEIEVLRTKLNENYINLQRYDALRLSYSEIEKRCVKHQKSEIEAKQQLTVHQDLINNLQREIQDLTKRLSVGAEDYRALFRKYTALERETKLNHKGKKSVIKTNLPSASLVNVDDEAQRCPVCQWDFPKQMAIHEKNEHIEHHF